MRASFNARFTQQGAVLPMALIILVMVSLLGLSAMRASVFSNKVATGIQADSMTFEAAETALGMTFRTLRDMSEEQLTAAVLDGTTIEYCITENGITSSSCGGQSMDSRNLLQARSFASHPPGNCRPVLGYDLERYSNLVINLLGESEMASYNIQNHHLQEGLKIGQTCM